MFCTNSEHEIVFVLISRTVRIIAGLQLVQESVVKFWLKIGEIMDLSHILFSFTSWTDINPVYP